MKISQQLFNANIVPLRKYILANYNLAMENYDLYMKGQEYFQNDIEAHINIIFGLLADCRTFHKYYIYEYIDHIEEMLACDSQNISDKKKVEYENVISAANLMIESYVPNKIECVSEFHYYDIDGTHYIFHDKKLGCNVKWIAVEETYQGTVYKKSMNKKQ